MPDHQWRGPRNNVIPVAIFLGIIILIGFKLPWWMWLLFFMFGVPTFTRLARKWMGGSSPHTNQRHYSQSRRHTSYDRRSREKRYRSDSWRHDDDDDDDWDDDDDDDDDDWHEKPKRRPIYTVGDDGELVELTDEPPVEPRKAKRTSGSEDGYEFI